MILGDDVQKVFEQCFHARRAVAISAERVRELERLLEVARTDLLDAESAQKSAEDRMQRLAERAAGVTALPVEDDTPAPRVNSEFRAIRR